MPCEHLCCSLCLNPTGEQMCEPASYFEQEAAAISRARGLGSPATSNPRLGENQLSVLSPPATRALGRGAARSPAFLKTLPNACQMSAFVFSLNFFPRRHAERKKGVSTVGLLWHSFPLLLETSPCVHAVMQPPPSSTTLLHKEEIFKP